MPELIRSEIRLAQAEVAEKGKRAGVGIGMFSVAGPARASSALATLITTAVLALALVVDAWLAALHRGAWCCSSRAAVAGLLGKKKVAAASPPVPERAVQGVKDDIATVKGGTP